MNAFERLAAPFPPERVSWRVGSVKKDGTAAMALAYLDARDVMERLDEVCSPGGWQNRYTHADRKTICEIGIFCNDEWVWKADGAGDSDIEAEKGALSDAFKRAAVRWGIGRYLYNLESPWVQIDQWKKILPAELTKLRKILERQAPVPVHTKGFEKGSPKAEDDFPGAEGSVGRTAYAVKTEDGGEMFNTLKAEIEGLGSMTEVGIFLKERTEVIKTLPGSWRTILRESLEETKSFLMAQTEEAT